MAQALAGAEEAYRTLVLRFQRPVLTVIGRLVQDRMLAEDLAQETFVKAFRNLRRYDARRKLASWLFKIAHNTAIDHLRRKRLPTDSLDGPDREGEAPRDSVPAPASEAPDRVMAGGALAAAIEAALSGLRPAYREVLTLRFQEGLAYEEIADVTGLPLGTVKVHLHRGRKQLATALEKAGWGPGETRSAGLS